MHAVSESDAPVARGVPGPRIGVARMAVAVLALSAMPALAQFKVVEPDGKVTYTDRAPAAGEGKVTTLGARAAPTSAEVDWPAELRQPVARYPVTLFVTAGECAPCSAARQFLRQRGIPFSEKLIVSAQDGEALERLSGGRDAPTLLLGSQTLRGLASELWNSYLDAAGYPRESRLPSTYQYPAPVPMTQRREVSAAPATP
ncbi:MAG: glutaredoxin family protein, partial [Burkholderiaceae bacterium]